MFVVHIRPSFVPGGAQILSADVGSMMHVNYGPVKADLSDGIIVIRKAVHLFRESLRRPIIIDFPKVVIEGPVLLHQDNDVLYIVDTASGISAATATAASPTSITSPASIAGIAAGGRRAHLHAPAPGQYEPNYNQRTDKELVPKPH